MPWKYPYQQHISTTFTILSKGNNIQNDDTAEPYVMFSPLRTHMFLFD